jgi:hypothetical protein
MTLQELKAILDIALQVVAVIGIPVSVFMFFRDRRLERLARERDAYNALDSSYGDYLKFCLAYPDLDVFDVPLEKPKKLTPAEKRQELIILTLLIEMFERAFVMYDGHARKVRRDQWLGWERYMLAWAGRENFRRAWDEVGADEFDTRFFDYMTGLIKRAGDRKGNS